MILIIPILIGQINEAGKTQCHNNFGNRLPLTALAGMPFAGLGGEFIAGRQTARYLGY